MEAYTNNKGSEFSNKVVNKTDIYGPSSPIILNLTCQSGDKLFVHWERPKNFVKSIDFYYIYIISEQYRDSLRLSTSAEHLETTFSISNLSTNSVYNIQLAASTISFLTGRLITGPLSEQRSIFLTPKCDQNRSFINDAAIELSIGMIAGLICSCIVITCAVIIFALWR